MTRSRVLVAVVSLGMAGLVGPRWRSSPPTAPRGGAGRRRAATDSAIHVIRVPTYDGSGSAVHPDVVRTPRDWGAGAGTLWMVVTPSAREYPSVYASADGLTWGVPAGAHHPIARSDSNAFGHLSDPAALFDPERRELLVYYRWSEDRDDLWLTRSHDGVSWIAPELVLTAHLHGALSPSVLRRASDQWEMYSVDAGRGCKGTEAHVDRRTSTDGRRWGPPAPVDLTLPWDGFFPWHIAVTWVPVESRYWALVNVKEKGDCETPALFLAVSRDGASWITFPQPLLERGAIPEFRDIVYRASLLYDSTEDAVRFWYSGARREGTALAWSLATQQLGRVAVRDRLRSGPILVPMMSRVAPARDTGRVKVDP